MAHAADANGDTLGGEAPMTADAGSFVGHNGDSPAAKKEMARHLSEILDDPEVRDELQHYLAPGYRETLKQLLDQYQLQEVAENQILDEALAQLGERWASGDYDDFDRFLEAGIKWINCHLNGGSCTLNDFL